MYFRWRVCLCIYLTMTYLNMSTIQINHVSYTLPEIKQKKRIDIYSPLQKHTGILGGEDMQFPFLGFGPIFQLAKELAGIRFHQRTQAMICSKSTFLQAFDLDKVSTSRCESIFSQRSRWEWYGWMVQKSQGQPPVREVFETLSK